MGILQWIFTGGIALTIICFLFAVYYIVSFIYLGSKIKKTKKKKKKTIKKIKQQRKKVLNRIIFSIILALSFGGGSWYISYYQSTNLSDEDMTNISDGYYYLRDLKEELSAIEDGEGNDEKSQQTINFIVTSLAGYRIKKASTLNTVDGQNVLNRYYNAMSELGINVGKNSSQLSTNPDIVKEILSDIEKVEAYQKKALNFFKVDISVLEGQK